MMMNLEPTINISIAYVDMVVNSNGDSIPLYVASAIAIAMSSALVYQTKRISELTKRLEMLHDEDRAYARKLAAESKQNERVA